MYMRPKMLKIQFFFPLCRNLPLLSKILFKHRLKPYMRSPLPFLPFKRLSGTYTLCVEYLGTNLNLFIKKNPDFSNIGTDFSLSNFTNLDKLIFRYFSVHMILKKYPAVNDVLKTSFLFPIFLN